MIYWPRIRQLRDEVGLDEFDEVVQIFMDEVDEGISRLQNDLARADFEQNLHFLKGSALSLGFEQFSKLCQDGERRSAAGQSEQVDLQRIISTFDASKAEFHSERARNLD